MILAVLFGGFQTQHMLVHSTRGLSTSMFLFTGLFVCINLYLSIASHKAQPSRVTRQTVAIYILGTVVYGSFLAVMLVKAESIWDMRDTFTGLVVIVALVSAFVYSKAKDIASLDPIMKGVYSLIFKSVPQVVMAWKVYQVGGQGLNTVMVITFHTLTLTRIYQICRRTSKTGWDRNRRGLLISEIGNEITWSLVTVAWLVS